MSWTGVVRRIRNTLARGGDGAEDRYRSPQEIALRNAADSLGVAIGDDYLQGVDVLPGDDLDAPDRVVAFREELLAYIAARKRRRRRRSLRIGMMLLLTASGALVASAVTETFSVNGVQRGPTRVESLGLLPPTDSILVPTKGSKVATSMPEADGDLLYHTAYKGWNDDICMSTAQVARGVTRSENGGECLPSSDVARAITRIPAFVDGTSGAEEHLLLDGLARSDLERIEADDPRVRIDISISSPWHPGGGAPKDLVLRTFLVRLWMGPGVRLDNGLSLVPSRGTLGLTAVFANGDKVSVADYREALEGERPPSHMVDPVLEPVRYSDCVVLLPGEELPPGKYRC